MKVEDILKLELPIKVKLNKGFNLDESFDCGTILQLNTCEVEDEHVYEDDGRCFVLQVTALKEDFNHNKSVSKKGWYNTETGKYDLDFFDGNKELKNENGDYVDTIYVMENDDWCDQITSSTKQYSEDQLFDAITFAIGLWQPSYGTFEENWRERVLNHLKS